MSHQYENTQFTLILDYLICTKVFIKHFGLRTKPNLCMCRRKALAILSKLSRLKEMLTLSTLIITYTEYHEEHWNYYDEFISLLLVSSFVVKFFLCHCMLPVPLWLDPALLFWFAALLFSTSDSVPPVTVNSWWLWMQLLCLLPQESSLFLWINKLVPLPLCCCLFVSMVHLHVSFGGGHRVLSWLIVFLTDLFITPCRLGFRSFLSCSCQCHFLLMLCLVVVAGFKVGGGEAVLAQDQPGTSREGTWH